MFEWAALKQTGEFSRICYFLEIFYLFLTHIRTFMLYPPPPTNDDPQKSIYIYKMSGMVLM